MLKSCSVPFTFVKLSEWKSWRPEENGFFQAANVPEDAFKLKFKTQSLTPCLAKLKMNKQEKEEILPGLNCF